MNRVSLMIAFCLVWAYSNLGRSTEVTTPEHLIDWIRSTRLHFERHELTSECTISGPPSPDVDRVTERLCLADGKFLSYMKFPGEKGWSFVGRIGDESLSFRDEDKTESRGGVIRLGGERVRTLPGGLISSVALFFTGIGSDLLEQLSAIDKWQVDAVNGVIVMKGSGQLGTSEFEHEFEIDNQRPFPIKSHAYHEKYDYPPKQRGATITKVLYEGSYVIEGSKITLPKSAKWTIGDVIFTTEVKSIKPTEFPEKVTKWKDIVDVIGVKDGSEVVIDDMRQIKFVWKDGEVVKKIDGTKLERLRGHSFAGGKLTWLVVPGSLVVIGLAMWLMKNARKTR